MAGRNDVSQDTPYVETPFGDNPVSEEPPTSTRRAVVTPASPHSGQEGVSSTTLAGLLDVAGGLAAMAIQP